MVAPNRNSNQTMRLSDYFDRPDTIRLLSANSNFADLVRGMITQLQKHSDANIDPEIKHYLNRKEFEEYGSDLKAMDIQRGRDFGLPSYNDAREFCGLRRASDWDDFASEISNEVEILRLESENVSNNFCIFVRKSRYFANFIPRPMTSN